VIHRFVRLVFRHQCKWFRDL